MESTSDVSLARLSHMLSSISDAIDAAAPFCEHASPSTLASSGKTGFTSAAFMTGPGYRPTYVGNSSPAMMMPCKKEKSIFQLTANEFQTSMRDEVISADLQYMQNVMRQTIFL
jgi:hypothetical protein